MFEVGWSELLVIGIVLIVVVGPKDLPRMLRTFGRTTSKLRKMAGDFRKQFDEALREAELDDVKDSVNEMRALNPASHVRKALNPIKAVGDEICSSLAAATKAPEPKVPAADAPPVMMPESAAGQDGTADAGVTGAAPQPMVGVNGATPHPAPVETASLPAGERT